MLTKTRTDSQRKITLDVVKTVVEICAIALAGGWALFEYGVKARENRLAGIEVRRANVQLSSDATTLDDGSHWVLSRLLISNPSQRVVRTFMMSWWYTYPPRPEKAQRRTAIANMSRVYSLAPGEQSEVQHLKRVPATEEAVVVHVEVVFEEDADGFLCRFAPNQALPDGGIEEMKDQPVLCAADPDTKDCSQKGCSTQIAESLVELARDSEAPADAGGALSRELGTSVGGDGGVRHTRPAARAIGPPLAR